MDKEIRKVDDVRDDITKIDYEIAELFEKRMGFAAELALSKKQAGESIYNKNKEDEKLSDITKNRSNPFVIKGLEEVFIQMMSISRKYQYHMVHQRDRYIENYFTEVPELVMFPDTRIVYPGVPGSFSEMACEKFFGADVDHYAVVNFKDVAMALNNGDADYGVLPIENSSAGDVTGVYDILLENDVCMVGEVFVKVEHCLLGGTDESPCQKQNRIRQGVCTGGAELRERPHQLRGPFEEPFGYRTKYHSSHRRLCEKYTGERGGLRDHRTTTG